MLNLLDVIELTNQAMLYELLTYPKFGLVSPYSTGSHQDMNHFTFIDSASVLNKYMYQFALLGYRDSKIEDLYDEAVKIGLQCEREMFEKTSGINTHKGLIFVLGTLVVSTYKTLFDHKPFEKIFENCSLLVSPKMDDFSKMNSKSQSHGEKVFLEYKIEGARKEAALGFPIIQKALNIINITDQSSLIKTLIYIMSMCDDTTIAYRKGIVSLEKIKLKMRELFLNGYEMSDLIQIDADFIKENISPGGSADLLCGTIFLSLIKNKYTNWSE